MKKNKPNNIILIGYMGTGKTTIANYIGLTKKLDIIDIDRIIEKNEGMLIKNIFLYKGEKYFRDRETEVLKSLKGKSDTIVSCGGGIILRDENINYIRSYGKVVLLKSTPITVYNRIKDCNKRPLLNNNMDIDFINNMMHKRNKNYMKAADIVIYNEEKTIDAVAMEIIVKLNTTYQGY